MTDTTRTYIYALVRPDHATTDTAGLDDVPVRTICRNKMAAVVSTVPADSFDPATIKRRADDVRWLESVARTHDAVVTAFAQHATTIPLRLGTTADDDDSVLALLDRLAPAAHRSFDRLQRHVEYGVQVFGPPTPALTATSTDESGVAFLRRRQAELQQDEARRVEQSARAQGAFDALAALASAGKRAEVRAPTETERAPMLLNAAFLVDAEAAAVFREAVDDVAASMMPDRVVINGPWAPYSFAELEL